MKYWPVVVALSMAVLFITPFNASAEDTLYDDLNYGWVNEDVLMNNYDPYTLAPHPDDPEFSLGRTNSSDSYCYYYWDSAMVGYSNGFPIANETGIYESSELYDDGAKLNPYDVQGDYYVFAILRNFTSSYYPEMPPIDAQLSKVIVTVKFLLRSDIIPEGWLSIQYHENTTIPALIPWTSNIREYDAKHHTLDSYGWYNSTLIPYLDDVAFLRWDDVVYLWDVTDFYAWNYTMITSDDLYVMWTGKQNCSDTAKICYLGVYWEWNLPYNPMSDEDNPFVVEPEEMPEVDEETNIMGIIWLVVLFIPAIAMGYFVPKLGFVAGMALMMIVLSATQTGFFVVMVIGMAALGATIYKG